MAHDLGRRGGEKEEEGAGRRGEGGGRGRSEEGAGRRGRREGGGGRDWDWLLSVGTEDTGRDRSAVTVTTTSISLKGNRTLWNPELLY